MSSAPLNFVKDRTEEACRSALHLSIPITAPLTWLSTETWTPPSAATLFPSPPWPRRSGFTHPVDISSRQVSGMLMLAS